MWQVIEPLLQIPTRDQRESEPTPTLLEIKIIIQTTVQEALQAPTSPPTWANIAAINAPQHQSQGRDPRARPVPARHEREVTIQTKDCPTDILQRTAPETIQAINRHLTDNPTASAARRLPSGDIVITFSDNASGRAADTEWVRNAFGPEATASRRQYTIIAKSVRSSSVRGDLTQLAQTISQTNGVTITAVKPQRNRREANERQSVVISLPTPQEANKLCNEGIIIEAEISHCEPYYEAAQPRQCYQCFQYGHIARYCKATPRCGRCGAAAHQDDSTCRAHSDRAYEKCLLCSGPHPAWIRACPEARKHWDQARDMYQHRPTHFQAPRSSRPNEIQPPLSTQDPEAGTLRHRHETDLQPNNIHPSRQANIDSDDGYTPVAKRRRGRPPINDTRTRDPTATRPTIDRIASRSSSQPPTNDIRRHFTQQTPVRGTQ